MGSYPENIENNKRQIPDSNENNVSVPASYSYYCKPNESYPQNHLLLVNLVKLLAVLLFR